MLLLIAVSCLSYAMYVGSFSFIKRIDIVGLLILIALSENVIIINRLKLNWLFYKGMNLGVSTSAEKQWLVERGLWAFSDKKKSKGQIKRTNLKRTNKKDKSKGQI